MSAGYDAEVADLFRDLRAASNLTEADLAARIATPVEVVQALEQGAIYALPPWPETCRVVSAYGTLLNLDTRPLLRRIYAQLEAGVVELGPKPVQDVPVMVPPAGGNPAAPTAQPIPPAGQPGPGWANGTPQPQAALQPAPQAAPQVAPQAAPQPAPAQAPSQTPAWPAASPGMPQPGAQQPHGTAPQAAPPHGMQPQEVQPQGVQPQAAQPQAAPPQAAPPHGTPSQPPQPLHPQARAPQAPQPPQPQPPQPQGGANPLDIAWPGPAAGGPAEPVAAPQADASFPDASFPEASSPEASFPGEPQPYPDQPGHAPDPGLAGAPMQMDDASFLGEPELEFVEEPEAKPAKSPLLKWGIIGLLAVVLLVGLWMVFGGSSGDRGLSSGFNTSDPVLDPDDPRSRKADRLPNNF